MIYQGYMDSYNNLDLTLLKSFFKRRLSVNLGVRNLFDVTNIPSVAGSGGVHSGGSSSAPVAWGRTYFVKLNYNFSKNEKADPQK